MIFVPDIYIIRTKMINKTHGKMDNLSFPGNLFCIFSFEAKFHVNFEMKMNGYYDPPRSKAVRI